MGKEGGRLSKAQRMQIKAYVCVLGFILVIVLLLGCLIRALLSQKEEPEPEEHIPVIEVLRNVWVMEADDNGLKIFADGQERQYTYGEVSEYANAREQIADITLTDGLVTDIAVKAEKINGRILSADDSAVEVEGYGKLTLAADYKGYRIYNSLSMCTAKDLVIGYDFADLVMENGKICGLLMVREESMEVIRVLLKTADFGALLHEQVVVSSDTDFTIRYGDLEQPSEEVHGAGEEIVITPDSPYFSGNRVVFTPNVLTGKVLLKNVTRSQGTPAYRGKLEILQTEGKLAVVNELPLEEYLYSVVPSEMPASYPGEALKAQAICARTYAYGHMRKAGYPQYGAHVDDSTSYQVYNNITEQESATTAVKETYGELLYTQEGELAGTYYYSTSCGVGSDARVWKTKEAEQIDYLSARSVSHSEMEVMSGALVENQENEGIMLTSATAQADTLGEELKDEAKFKEFITSKDTDDFEVSENWYRWSYQVPEIDVNVMNETLKKRYHANEKLVLTMDGDEFVAKEPVDFTQIKDMYIAKRGVGGVADELVIVTEKNTYKVISEHNIRYVLDDGKSKVVRQDGSKVDMPTILPSGFFVLTVGKEKENVVGYTLSGGGFGHGVGMSQNAAKQMAENGYESESILLFFYNGCVIRKLY